mmetsp:Transcript_14539/g.37132  ORF Transcript_14539/g.37132 Transcript_14539/m.37132 type:complete len:401 (-) Transcript_14539:41-1243(-)|eukprot:CAMPEP_0174905062 /NCGR_PEP_ID=MMETSP0167-20121228/51355_1 /TAXON_ID=38298 /ORGANISM="Rhodella maculata, Strain CCMP736" /LENGTH=400 /DNA_ID=CAMNT_0016147887 /DNA_START=157 /DNA_END=1359 /DNA_ORIENTATION=-
MAAVRIGPYILSDTIGQGALGKVKLAIHIESKKEYAVKVFDKADVKANQLTSQIARQFSIMKMIDHRNIIKLREVLNSPKKLYMVMDLVRGNEIFKLLEQKGPLDEITAMGYFHQLIEAVEYCHKKGIYHRDLKPEKLLIDFDGTLKLSGFAVSAMADPKDNLLHTSVGTPLYAAPELLAVTSTTGYSGAKVDVWSSGVILYLFLTGELPFYDETMQGLFELIRAANPEYPPSFPESAKDLCSKMLTLDPDARIDIAGVKQHPWFLKNGTKKLSLVVQPDSSSNSTREIFADSIELHADNKAPRRGSDLSNDGSGIFNTRDISAEFDGKNLTDFVRSALSGAPEKKIKVVTKKLKQVGIETIEDLQAIAAEQVTTEELKYWLESHSIPSVTALRLAKMFK